MAVNLRLFPPIREINDPVAADFLRTKLFLSRNAKKNQNIRGLHKKLPKALQTHTMAVLTESMISSY